MNRSLLSLSFLFFSFFLSGTIAAQTETAPRKYQSLLWEITGNGMKKPSYLYGTMHVSDKVAFNLTDSFFVAIKNCDAVALELNMDTWMDEIMKTREANAYKNTAMFYAKPYGFYKGAFDLDIPKEKDLKGLLQFSPSISNSLLYRNNRYESDYEEDNYLDVFIFQSGKKLNKKIFGLENFRTTEEFSARATIETAELVEDEKAKEDIDDQNRLRLKQITNGRTQAEAIEDVYRKGDLDLLDSINKLSDTPLFTKYMLNERNKIMAAHMDSIMQLMPLFTGVGAAHLPGNDGVIELLRKMGYKVRPVISSQYDTKTKTKIDETRVPVTFHTEYVPDSTFSVSVPGKLSEFYDKGSYKYYLNNDMSNGSYYCIQRMNHYGSLTNETPEHILKRIDTLIFENISGKLLSKKEIKSQNGYPGVEITNKTRKGDSQRYQIFISPSEIFIFKMSGSQDYVSKGTEAEAFFSSIRFQEKNAAPSRYKSALGYSVDLPSTKVVYSGNGLLSYQQEIVCANEKANDKYAITMMASLYDYEYIEEDTFELNMLTERFCRQANYALLNREQLKEKNGAAMQFSAQIDKKPGSRIFGRVIISGPDYFLLVTNRDSTSAQDFFNSFRTEEKISTAKYATIQDTSLFFSASTQSKTNEYTHLTEVQSKAAGARYKKKEKNSKNDEKFLPKRESIVYTSPETGEQVYVEFRKFSMFFQQEDMETFWKSRIQTISSQSGMVASRIVKTKNDKFSQVDLLLTDTNSTRGISVKLIQRCGSLYTLKAVVDTVTGMSNYAKTFFDSFVPKDTCIGLDVTSNKLDTYFFDKLYSSDTAVAKQTKTAIEYVQVNMLQANVPSLISTIENKEFSKLATSDKKELLYSFGSLRSKEVLPFLEKTYTRFADSVEVQLTVLKAIARQKTVESCKSFLKLLRSDLPVTSSDLSIANVFVYFYDSLQTSATLFPEILKYTKYPEYKTTIYKLFRKLKEENLIKPKAYKKQVDGILMDGNYELKKFMSEKDRDREPSKYLTTTKSGVLYDGLNSSQQKMYCYAALLSPYYKKGSTKAFFDKLLKTTNSDKFKVMIYGTLIKNNCAPPDTVLRHYASALSSRITLYQVLKEQNKLDRFDKKYGKQKELVISQLFGAPDNPNKDTVALVSKIATRCDNKDGYFYVFKARPKDKKVWKLYCSGVHPADEDQVNLNPDFTKTNVAFENDVQLKKTTDGMLQLIRIDNRKRASSSDFETKTATYEDYMDY
ncbi:MAG: TraB/GumN family protein [Bacteroidia bacterium]